MMKTEFAADTSSAGGLWGPAPLLLHQANPLSQAMMLGYLLLHQSHFSPQAREPFLKENKKTKVRDDDL